MSINSQSLKQRRRRVALDQNTSANETEAVAAGTSIRESGARQAASQPYTVGARRSSRLKTTDFIPKRLRVVFGLAIVLILAILALNAVHYAVPWLEPALGQSIVSTFSLDSSRGLNAWYCNCLLLLSGATCIQIYLLRRHRRDDYRGSYRLWLWFAAMFFLSSMATVTSISHVLEQAFQNLAGSDGSSAFWPALILFTTMSVLIARGFFEVRRSRLAVVALAIVFLGYGGTLLLHLFPELSNRVSALSSAVPGNLVLIAPSALLFGTICFARYVYLEAIGLTKVTNDDKSKTVKKTLRSKNKKAEKDQNDSVRSLKRQASRDGSENNSSNRHEETGTNTRSDKRKVATESSNSEGSNPLLSKRSERNSGRPDNRVGSGQTLGRPRSYSDSDDDGYSGLSKSELRRLRKQKRRAS